MKEDVFRFDDFLKEKNESKIDSKDIRKIIEEIDDSDLDIVSDDTEENIIFSESEDTSSNLPSQTATQDEPQQLDKEDSTDDESVESEIEDEIQVDEPTDNYYKLYSDKSEDFVCDISIEGANPKETEARIVIESEDWTLMFSGEIKNGKCLVPIKKLNILKENQIGNIRLEVIAEGNLFVPWEDKFKVKLSKKVTVKVNEQKNYSPKPIKKESSVKVKVRK